MIDEKALEKALRTYDDYWANEDTPGEALRCAIEAYLAAAPLPGAANLAAALRGMLQAVCGETGFANAVRVHSETAYPWEALDIAEKAAHDALAAAPLPTLCEDCPPIGYPTDKTRCEPCPRAAAPYGGQKND